VCEPLSHGGRPCSIATRPAYQAMLDAYWAAQSHPERAAALDLHTTAIVTHALTPPGKTDFDIFVASVHAAHEAEPLADDEDVTGRAQVAGRLALLCAQVDMRAHLLDLERRRLRYQRTGTHAPQVPGDPEMLCHGGD
jgi:hypothetical protein